MYIKFLYTSSRDLLYTIYLQLAIWYLLKCVKTYFILSVLTKQQQKRKQKFGEMNIFTTMIMVVVSWVFAKAQTNQNAYIKCVQFYQFYLNKAKKIQ